jgi:hypothetical protein
VLPAAEAWAWRWSTPARLRRLTCLCVHYLFLCVSRVPGCLLCHMRPLRPACVCPSQPGVCIRVVVRCWSGFAAASFHAVRMRLLAHSRLFSTWLCFALAVHLLCFLSDVTGRHASTWLLRPACWSAVFSTFVAPLTYLSCHHHHHHLHSLPGCPLLTHPTCDPLSFFQRTYTCSACTCISHTCEVCFVSCRPASC